MPLGFCSGNLRLGPLYMGVYIDILPQNILQLVHMYIKLINEFCEK